MDKLADGTLIERYLDSLRNRDMKAFKIFFEAYYPKVHAYVRSFSIDTLSGEDISQNVFIKIWFNIENLIPDPSKIESYIFRIAKNEVLNYFRSREVNRKYQEGVCMDLAKDFQIPDIIDAKQSLRMIEMIVSKMPEARRRIFMMSRFENLTNEEIATRLGISKRTVEKQISLSLKQIRASLTSFSALISILLTH